ncbi:hypothetical protein EK21DRAFT_99871 [Setomelanomma holmii]|uniref:F-box domain-containing protein n=1 Tax=Setomelanomma holmii TaxID=210430 RepID=A0A9P4HE02_9PLEO|nr:hypothetical protein EK21DRAFT_99871 [Setomelanomma holmii]
MDDLLPSYESAIHQDPWALVAQYLPSETLCCAALVCRAWHGIMTPQLWGNPASHFGVQNDTVYVALTRFKRILPYVRPSVRDLTHTLQFPPAHAEIYGGPHAEWLRDCLEYLPRLQCLLVNGLPFFDHSALLCLRHTSLKRRTQYSPPDPVYGLRLLDASGCSNATSMGLAEALRHVPSLVSLDLSRTPAAKDESVMSKLRYLVNLRLLSLKGLGLKDADFELIARSIGTRVRSLEVSDNYLTDTSARLLLEHCVKEDAIENHRTLGPLSPVEHDRLNGDVDSFESENVVGHVRRKLTTGFVGSLAVEDARDVGITHLYLSKNAFTVEGVSGLLRSKRVQVLDIGTLATVLERPYSSGTFESAGELELPGVAKLTPTLSRYAAAKLKYLRINYEVVTEDAPSDAIASPRAELGGDPGRHTPSNAHELEAFATPTPELDTEDTAIFELSGESNHPTELSGESSLMTDRPKMTSTAGASRNVKGRSIHAPTIEVTAETHEVKRGAAYAPEPVHLDCPPSPVSPLQSPHKFQFPTFQESRHDSALLSPLLPTSADRGRLSISKGTPNRSRHNSIHYVEDRQARLDHRQSQENCLHPGMIPKVHTLVLTDVPTSTSNPEVVKRLIQYIDDAAEEAAIARQRARHTYVLPPGRTRATAEREYAHNLFGLRRLVLEMAPPRAAPKKVSSSWRAYPTKSSTEDADSEAFWEAATYDFSFFGDEECGLPDLEPGRTVPLTAMSGLELAPERPKPPLQAKPDVGSRPLFDVVSEISKFRKEQKAIYNNLLVMGEYEPEVEGYWPGDVTVIRKAADQDAGELDCYGNRYESGWYYR